MGSKMSSLIEDVLEYWEAYKGLVPIMFDTYNICNGRNGGLDSVLRGMSQDNIDLGIFQEERSPTASTPAGRKGIASLQQTHQAITTAE